MKIYQTNIEACEKEISNLEERTKSLSQLRLVTFLLSVVTITFLANESLITLLCIVAPLCMVGFASLLIRYNRVNDDKNSKSLLKTVNENELLKLENKLSGFPTGKTHLKKDHPYTADLDIFGSHSLFQLLDRTTTESGSLLLAKWLSEPASKEIILERQKAIQELIPNLEWRQQLQVDGLPFINSKSDYQKLLKWCKSSEQLLPQKTKYFIGSIVLGVISTISGVLFVVNFVLGGWNIYLLPLLVALFISSFLLRKFAPLAEEIIDHMDQNVQVLGGYQKMAQTISSGAFESKRLKKLQLDLNQNTSSAAHEIRKLRKILEAFQIRGTKRSMGNAFYGLLNNFWLLDIHYIILTERWKHSNKGLIKPWIEAISEFEVLNSLGGFAYSNANYAFPEIKDEPYCIHFEMLGHPLLTPESRICNDFSLNGNGQITMITGSNMAGKSTFLRTVGVNLALALMGAPCCSTSGKVSNMNMFTSMRTQDNLEEGASSFYAELKRVEQLLALIKSGEPTFFMLDEVFKGTNSKDRYKGGVSLIKQLSELNAFGIISTHDLELAKLADKHMIVSNYSFNSKIEGDEMTFDYKLTAGICTDFNASALMKKSGIKILDDIENMD